MLKTTTKVQKEFAIIETGGKQYQVSEGDIVTVEKIADDMKEGDSVTFENVLLVDDGENTTLGTPYIKGARVIGTLKEAGRAKKITIVRFKSKSRYHKKRGHRQPFMKVQIEKIS
jgi:large subunit ribosomal protein L21